MSNQRSLHEIVHKTWTRPLLIHETTSLRWLQNGPAAVDAGSLLSQYWANNPEFSMGSTLARMCNAAAIKQTRLPQYKYLSPRQIASGEKLKTWAALEQPAAKWPAVRPGMMIVLTRRASDLMTNPPPDVRPSITTSPAHHKTCVVTNDRFWQHARNQVISWHAAPCHCYCLASWFTRPRRIKCALIYDFSI